MKKIYLLTFILVGAFLGFAQSPTPQDTVQLTPLTVVGMHLNNRANSLNSKMIAEDQIKTNGFSLTELLNFNTHIYFRENGAGMVSSPSFRGTTAQQTVVLWNDIPITSRFLGQNDFNALSAIDADQITVSPGGASVINGSGAIGGTINLQNTLNTQPGTRHNAWISAGSFGSFQSQYQIEHSQGKWATKAAYAFTQSDNDYEVEERNYKNQNAQFHRHALSTHTQYQWNAKNKLSFHAQGYTDERNFALISPTETPTKYQNKNIRSMLQWQKLGEKFESKTSLAYLYEEFRFFENIAQPYTTLGKIHSGILNFQGKYHFSNKVKLTSLLDFQHHGAQGENTGISNAQQTQGSMGILLKHTFAPKWNYEAGIKKVISNDFESPLLFSLGVHWNPSKFYQSKLQFSQNFRQPTFNDLYWNPGGNPDLVSEKSIQLDWNHEFTFKNWKWNIDGFYYKINDMIRWLPQSNGLFSPVNTQNVTIHGLEISGAYTLAWQKNQLNLSAAYSYTSSIDNALDKQLTYTPLHKIHSNLVFERKKWNTYLQGVYIGEVFTQTDNAPNATVAPYPLINAGIEAKFFATNPLKIGLQLRNLTNEIYESVENRPMPKRHFLIQINYSIN